MDLALTFHKHYKGHIFVLYAINSIFFTTGRKLNNKCAYVYLHGAIIIAFLMSYVLKYLTPNVRLQAISKTKKISIKFQNFSKRQLKDII